VEAATALAEGRMTRSFENRFVRADGSERVLEWTAAPVVDEGVMYGVARDVTERRRAERELERLAAEQAALRRVATLVATGATPAEVFAAVASEVERLLAGEAAAMPASTAADRWSSSPARVVPRRRCPPACASRSTRRWRSGRCC
jgi:hypothetical protein